MLRRVYLETLRWSAAIPLVVPWLSKAIYLTFEHLLAFHSGLPHRLMEDDVYNGMYIPQSSLVFGNIWYVVSVLGSSLILNSCRAMLRDENLYPDPSRSNPERFLEESKPWHWEKNKSKKTWFWIWKEVCPFFFPFGNQVNDRINETMSRHALVDSSVWLVIASLLATLRISNSCRWTWKIPSKPEVKYENPSFRYLVHICPLWTERWY